MKRIKRWKQLKLAPEALVIRARPCEAKVLTFTAGYVQIGWQPEIAAHFEILRSRDVNALGLFEDKLLVCDLPGISHGVREF